MPGTRRDPARHGITHATRIAFFLRGPRNPLRAIILSTFKYFNVVHLEGKKVFLMLSQHVKVPVLCVPGTPKPQLHFMKFLFGSLEKELEQVIRSTFKYFIVVHFEKERKVLSRDEPYVNPLLKPQIYLYTVRRYAYTVSHAFGTSAGERMRPDSQLHRAHVQVQDKCVVYESTVRVRKD